MIIWDTTPLVLEYRIRGNGVQVEKSIASQNCRWLSYKWEIAEHRNNGLLDGWKERVRMISRRITNRLRRAYNGNRGARNSVQIAHWNLGSCKWEKENYRNRSTAARKGP